MQPAYWGFCFNPMPHEELRRMKEFIKVILEVLKMLSTIQSWRFLVLLICMIIGVFAWHVPELIQAIKH